jgi:hypothetical protein
MRVTLLTREKIEGTIAEILQDNQDFEDRSGRGTYEPFYDPVYEDEHSCWDRETEEEDNCRSRARRVCERILEAL